MRVKYAFIEKREGETPLMTLEAYRAAHPELLDVPLTYAGRLDPMASGALLILIGEECRRRDAYTRLDKEYEFGILFGVSSDTGDVLGIIRAGEQVQPPENELRNVLGPETLRLPYPAFSSKTVNGIPLFRYALECRLGEIEIPETDMAIRSVEYLGSDKITARELRADVAERVGKLTSSSVNDFRKDAVLESWRTLQDGEYAIARYEATVSSGTYIRALAEEAGRRLGVSALAYRIHRTKILMKNADPD